jgi:transposase
MSFVNEGRLSDSPYIESIWRADALRLYVDGMNQRRIARTLGVSHQSVANWIKDYAERLPQDPPESQDTPLDVSELDELFSFVGDKKRRVYPDRG